MENCCAAGVNSKLSWAKTQEGYIEDIIMNDMIFVNPFYCTNWNSKIFSGHVSLLEPFQQLMFEEELFWKQN